MLTSTPSTTTLLRKRGGQPGNSNALVHGFRSVQHPHPGLALVSPRPLDSRSLVTDFIVQHNLRLLDEVDHVLVMLVPRMFSASSSHEMLSWFRPILKLIRVKQRLMRSTFLLENPEHTLHFLARNAFGLAYLEFLERGLREFPIAPPADFEDFCADPSSTTYAFRNNSIIPPSGQRVFVWQVFNKSAQIALSRGDIKSPHLHRTAERSWRLSKAFCAVQVYWGHESPMHLLLPTPGTRVAGTFFNHPLLSPS